MKLVPIFNGTSIVGIRFVPDGADEDALLRAFAANGDEQPSGDRTMAAKVVAVDSRAAYGLVVGYAGPLPRNT